MFFFLISQLEIGLTFVSPLQAQAAKEGTEGGGEKEAGSKKGGQEADKEEGEEKEDKEDEGVEKTTDQILQVKQLVKQFSIPEEKPEREILVYLHF